MATHQIPKIDYVLWLRLAGAFLFIMHTLLLLIISLPPLIFHVEMISLI